MPYYKNISSGGSKYTKKYTNTPILDFNSAGINELVIHLKKATFVEAKNGMRSILRQYANDIRDNYRFVTPLRTNPSDRTGKYNTLPGNLKKSLRVYPKREKSYLAVGFSIGPKKHRSGELIDKHAAWKAKSIKKKGKLTGNPAADGYYLWMVNYGVAGRKKGGKSTKSLGFVQRARAGANKMIDSEASERVKEFAAKKLQKLLDKQGLG